MPFLHIVAVLTLSHPAPGRAAAPRPAAMPDPVNACSLLTAAEVSSVIGIKSLPGQNPPPPFKGGDSITAMCTFAATPDAGMGDPKVLITVLSPNAATFNDAMTLPGATRTPVPGIGDKAVFVTFKAPGAVPYLAVRKGDGAFEIRVSGAKSSLTQKQAMETALAKIAVGRL